MKAKSRFILQKWGRRYGSDEHRCFWKKRAVVKAAGKSVTGRAGKNERLSWYQHCRCKKKAAEKGRWRIRSLFITLPMQNEATEKEGINGVKVGLVSSTVHNILFKRFGGWKQSLIPLLPRLWSLTNWNPYHRRPFLSLAASRFASRLPQRRQSNFEASCQRALCSCTGLIHGIVSIPRSLLQSCIDRTDEFENTRFFQTQIVFYAFRSVPWLSSICSSPRYSRFRFVGISYTFWYWNNICSIGSHVHPSLFFAWRSRVGRTKPNALPDTAACHCLCWNWIPGLWAFHR